MPANWPHRSRSDIRPPEYASCIPCLLCIQTTIQAQQAPVTAARITRLHSGLTLRIFAVSKSSSPFIKRLIRKNTSRYRITVNYGCPTSFVSDMLHYNDSERRILSNHRRHFPFFARQKKTENQNGLLSFYNLIHKCFKTVSITAYT